MQRTGIGRNARIRMKYLILFATVFLSPYGVYALPVETGSNLEIRLKEAYARLESRDYQGAVELFSTVVSTKANLPWAYYGLAKSYHELGKLDSALANYNKTLELDKKNAKALSNRGLIHGAKGNMKRAIEDFSRAIDINPNYDHAFSNRGVAKGALGDTAGAISDFTKAITINPRYGAAWLNRGITKEIIGDIKSACADWKKAAQLGQNVANTWIKIQCN